MLDQNEQFALESYGSGLIGVVDAYPIVETSIPDQPATAGFGGKITPGTVVLALIAVGGVALGRLSEQRFGVSTRGSVR